jgi:uncharacterized surface protein with fasciclin (FAS1) repeats
MSDQGGRDPEPTEFFPPFPTEREEPTGTELPPIGADRDPEPTRVLPPPGPDAGPTEPLPPVGGPYDPGPPYDGGGPGGGGGGGGGDDFSDEPEPEPWWRQPGPLAALIAGVAALVLGVIALIVWAGGGDDDGSGNTLPVLPTSSTLSSSTVVSTSSTLPETTTTTTSTTVPETTTSTSTTTTTTTTAPPTTTTTTTTPPTTTTTIPVVTVPDPGGATTWDLIANSPDLSEMRNAIEQAGLVDLFRSDQITALASSNTAFQTLRATPAGEELLEDPERLAALLRRQVVVASVSAAEFPLFGELESAATPEDCELLGADEDCGLLEGGGDAENPTVDGASFLVENVDASNGLLDVIDRVLVP